MLEGIKESLFKRYEILKGMLGGDDPKSGVEYLLKLFDAVSEEAKKKERKNKKEIVKREIDYHLLTLSKDLFDRLREGLPGFRSGDGQYRKRAAMLELYIEAEIMPIRDERFAKALDGAMKGALKKRRRVAA